MEVFKELEALAPAATLTQMVNLMTGDLREGWVRDSEAEAEWEKIGGLVSGEGYAFAIRGSTLLPDAGVFLLMEGDRLRVVNIVPLAMGQLSYSQYNAILDHFAELNVRPAARMVGAELRVTSGMAGPEAWMSREAAEVLRRFSGAANKATGSSHPCDMRRWTEFLIITHREGASLDAGTLQRYLVEELDWPGETAWTLAVEYEFARNLLTAYDRS